MKIRSGLSPDEVDSLIKKMQQSQSVLESLRLICKNYSFMGKSTQWVSSIEGLCERKEDTHTNNNRLRSYVEDIILKDIAVLYPFQAVRLRMELTL